MLVALASGNRWYGLNCKYSLSKKLWYLTLKGSFAPA